MNNNDKILMIEKALKGDIKLKIKVLDKLGGRSKWLFKMGSPDMQLKNYLEDLQV